MNPSSVTLLRILKLEYEYLVPESPSYGLTLKEVLTIFMTLLTIPMVAETKKGLVTSRNDRRTSSHISIDNEAHFCPVDNQQDRRSICYMPGLTNS